jgi:hypothetical protein
MRGAASATSHAWLGSAPYFSCSFFTVLMYDASLTKGATRMRLATRLQTECTRSHAAKAGENL